MSLKTDVSTLVIKVVSGASHPFQKLRRGHVQVTNTNQTTNARRVIDLDFDANQLAGVFHELDYLARANAEAIP